MKTLAAAAALLGGALLIAIPRFLFPTCEAIGRGRMHCTELARGEYVAGALLLAAGALLLALPAGGKAIVAASFGALLLCAAALYVPSYTRYCSNPDMPCRYGMAPGVRFVAAAAGIAQGVALAGLLRARRRREP